MKTKNANYVTNNGSLVALGGWPFRRMYLRRKFVNTQDLWPDKGFGRIGKRPYGRSFTVVQNALQKAVIDLENSKENEQNDPYGPIMTDKTSIGTDENNNASALSEPSSQSYLALCGQKKSPRKPRNVDNNKLSADATNLPCKVDEANDSTCITQEREERSSSPTKKTPTNQKALDSRVRSKSSPRQKSSAKEKTLKKRQNSIQPHPQDSQSEIDIGNQVHTSDTQNYTTSNNNNCETQEFLFLNEGSFLVMDKNKESDTSEKKRVQIQNSNEELGKTINADKILQELLPDASIKCKNEILTSPSNHNVNVDDKIHIISDEMVQEFFNVSPKTDDSSINISALKKSIKSKNKSKSRKLQSENLVDKNNNTSSHTKEVLCDISDGMDNVFEDQSNEKKHSNKNVIESKMIDKVEDSFEGRRGDPLLQRSPEPEEIEERIEKVTDAFKKSSRKPAPKSEFIRNEKKLDTTENFMMEAKLLDSPVNVQSKSNSSTALAGVTTTLPALKESASRSSIKSQTSVAHKIDQTLIPPSVFFKSPEPPISGSNRIRAAFKRSMTSLKNLGRSKSSDKKDARTKPEYKSPINEICSPQLSVSSLPSFKDGIGGQKCGPLESASRTSNIIVSPKSATGSVDVVSRVQLSIHHHPYKMRVKSDTSMGAADIKSASQCSLQQSCPSKTSLPKINSVKKSGSKDAKS